MRRTLRTLETALIAVSALALGTLPVHAQTTAAKAKADSVRADSIKKANAKKAAAATPATKAATPAATKPATNKAATTTPAKTSTGSSTSKPAATTSKPAAPTTAPKAAAADSKTPASTTRPASGASGSPASSTPAKTTAPASSGSSGSATTRSAPASAQTSRAASSGSTGTPRPQEPSAYTSFSLYGGMAQGSLGFGTGANAGLALRIKRASLPVILRFDVSGSRFSQTPTAFGGTTPLSDKASLIHAGATASLEIPLVNRGSVRPYLVAGGGVFRFQGDGPAGNNGTISNGVFTSTTDGALNAGGGVLLGRHVFLEARYITVGDFNSIPVVLGFVFR